MFHVEHTAPHPHPHVGKPLTPTTFRGCFFGWTVSHKISGKKFPSTNKTPFHPTIEANTAFPSLKVNISFKSKIKKISRKKLTIMYI